MLVARVAAPRPRPPCPPRLSRARLLIEFVDPDVPHPLRRRRRLIVVAVVAVLLVAGGAVAVVVLRNGGKTRHDAEETKGVELKDASEIEVFATEDEGI